MATHSNILAWRIPMGRVAWRAAVMGSHQTWLSDEHTIYIMIQLNATSSKKVTQSTYQKLLCLNLWPTIRAKVFLFFTWIKLESLKFYHEVLERKDGNIFLRPTWLWVCQSSNEGGLYKQPSTAFSWTSKSGYLWAIVLFWDGWIMQVKPWETENYKLTYL